MAGVAQQAAVAAVFLAGVAQQEPEEEVAQQEDFFFAKMQWPLVQLLSRRLVETSARVISDFMI